ncbi:hypothetical protein EJ02DRAFT_475944 [Clathrospora elynae]|uniref:Serine-threonine/tyrosine-protein kinase catalytic domain-containing protein n=1 Tax=Clathrospora elynae TaxID=706981 RepID=A0A6A5SCP9_9PLEO|nr:hypothetical protein EJ02DRAFT_475944 [Clathrospora elynae]
MARTVRVIQLQPSATDERSAPIPLNLPGFSTRLGQIEATQLDENSVILVPDMYIDDPDDSVDARWRGERGSWDCWKTTVIYEQIGKTHPHLVPQIGIYAACPVLAKPSGPPVADFVQQSRAAMYSTPIDAVYSRILASNRPLIYQWALHPISGLSFIHAHDIVFGDLDLRQCWLSSDSHLSLSLVGFVHAGFRRSTDGAWYDGRQTNAAWFHPLEHQSNSTTQTDLFLYGCVVYELITGAWPGDRLVSSTGIEHVVNCVVYCATGTEIYISAG